MMDHDGNDQVERGEFAAPSGDRERDIGAVKSKVVRFGWVTCLAGLIVTLIGARQLATEGAFPTALPRLIHSLGLIILLVGFSVALLGYRLPGLLAIFQWPRSSRSRRRRAMERSPEELRSRLRRKRLVSTCLWLGGAWLGISLVILGLAPDWLAGLYISASTLVLTSSAAVIIVGGSDLQRAFAIGAIVPLASLGHQLWFGSFSAVTSRAIWAGYSGGGASGGLDWILPLFESLGATARWMVLAIWLAALLGGLLAMGVRIVLDYLNESGDAASDLPP